MGSVTTETTAPAQRPGCPPSTAGPTFRLSLGKERNQVVVQEVHLMGEPLSSPIKQAQKAPPSSRRPLAKLFRRRSSSNPDSSRRASDASDDLIYMSPPDSSVEAARAGSRLTSPSMPSLALFRPRTRSRTDETDESGVQAALSTTEMPSKPFARQTAQDSSESISSSVASPRPSIMSQASARTSQTSNASDGRSPVLASAPPSPTETRRPLRSSSASTPTSTVRPGPTPVAGSGRSSSSAQTRPLRARTASRLSFSSISQTLGASAPRPPPDAQTAARLRTLPRLLSYSAAASASPTQAPQASTSALPPPIPLVNDLPSPPYVATEFYASRASPQLFTQPFAATSVVETEPIESSAADMSDTDEETSDDDAFVNPELAEREEEGPNSRHTPRAPRMRLDMPQRSTPDRFVATPVTTPRLRGSSASPNSRSTPQMSGWTTFSQTPGLTPFTARPQTTSQGGSYFDLQPFAREPESVTASPQMVTAATSPVLPQGSPVEERPMLASRRSRSLVNLLEPAREPSPQRAVLAPVIAPQSPTSPSPGRPRSMYEMREPPPVYNSLDRAPVPEWVRNRDRMVLPREDEGAERLPNYTCDVHIEGYLPRKMEFTSPGIQAGNRTWRKQYIILHGTSIKIYKADPAVYMVPDETSAVATARRMSVSSATSYSVSMTSTEGSEDESTAPAPLHVHEGRYGEEAGESNEGFTATLLHAHLPGSAGQNACLRAYSLQGAESGLAADYLKRKHVVRVRAEGEQFLLQMKDDRGVIDIIEALQAATNVSMDLDERPLPKFITLPRRRRRRRAAADPNAAATADAAAPGTADMPAPREGGRMHDMLAEEQEAYMRA